MQPGRTGPADDAAPRPSGSVHRPFRFGFDPRRHIFTAADCRLGSWRACESLIQDRPWVLKWLNRKVTNSYQETTNVPKDVWCRCGPAYAMDDCEIMPF